MPQHWDLAELNARVLIGSSLSLFRAISSTEFLALQIGCSITFVEEWLISKVYFDRAGAVRHSNCRIELSEDTLTWETLY